jgi:hypothetical protein
MDIELDLQLGERMTRFELGYISGLIDGEGYIGICKNYCKRSKKFGYVCVLSVANINLNALLYLKKVIGFGVVGRDKKYKDRSVVYRYRINANNLRKLLPKLRLLIKDRDRLQVIEALDLLKKINKNVNNLTKNLYIYSKLEEIYSSIRRRHANRD